MTTATYPVGTTPAKRFSTLLDVATVKSGLTWLADGRDLFDTYNCMRFDATDAALCDVNTLDLDTQGPTWISGFFSTAYGAILCKAVGLDVANMRSQAEAVFTRGESFAVERALMENNFVEGPIPSGGTDPEWEAPTDITPTPGTAVSASVGLALLEGHASTHYVGQPTIHMPVTIASLLAPKQAFDKDGDHLATKLGAKVAVGAGYETATGPDGSTADPGTKWMWATGEVMVLQGETIVPDVPVNLDNEVIAMVQRPYITAVDCYSAAVLVEVS